MIIPIDASYAAGVQLIQHNTFQIVVRLSLSLGEE